MFGGFSTGKCKTNCKLTVGRVKLMRNKKNLQVTLRNRLSLYAEAKKHGAEIADAPKSKTDGVPGSVWASLVQLRREVAGLLRANKQDNARIRVEAVIQEQKMLRAYDIIEVFVELLAVRVELIAKSKDIPPDMLEAVSSVVYAAQRIQDFPELGVIRGLLGHKFGREYISEASDDTVCRKWQVNENLRSVLAIDSPPNELKLQMLSEIAQEEGVEWDAHAASRDLLPSQPPALGPGYFGSGPPPGGPPGGPPNYGGGPPQGPSGGSTYPTGENQYSAAAGMAPPTSLPGARGGPQQPPGNPQGFAGSNGAQNFGGPSQQNFSQQNNTRGPKPSPGGGGGNMPLPTQNQAQFSNQYGQPPVQQDRGVSQMLGMPGPDASPGEWADAMAAATAARQYSEQARAAAESAERYAAARSQQGGESSSNTPAASTAASGTNFQSQPPPKATYPQNPPTLPPGNPPAPTEGPPGFPPTPPSVPQAPTNAAKPAADIAGYRQRSAEDIQRDYDAVPGYSKTQPGPPSAPSAPSAPPPAAPQAPGEAKTPNDFEELTKRLEALRRNT